MIIIAQESLQINIPDTEPTTRRNWLIKAIAAAMRWEAMCPHGDKYEEDGQHKYVLAQLLEELVNE